MYERDPVSVLFDSGARRLLERAYARPGQWTGTRIAGPSAAHVAWFAALGINVLGREDETGRDRWASGFVRAVYYQHHWHRTGRGWGGRRMVPYDGRAIRYELGRRLPALGVIPAGRAVRIMSVPGGPAARRAAQRMPAGRRVLAGEGQPGPLAMTAVGRDWEGLQWDKSLSLDMGSDPLGTPRRLQSPGGGGSSRCPRNPRAIRAQTP